MTFSGGQNHLRERASEPGSKTNNKKAMAPAPPTSFSFGFRDVANRALNLGELLPQVLIGKKIGPSYGK